MQDLFVKGLNVNLTNRKNETALHLAVKYLPKIVEKEKKKAECDDKYNGYSTGAMSIFEILCDNSVDINVQDQNGLTPLHLAVKLKKVKMIKSLLAKGASTELKDKKGKIALDYANECLANDLKILDSFKNLNFIDCPKDESKLKFVKKSKKMVEMLSSAASGEASKNKEKK